MKKRILFSGLALLSPFVLQLACATSQEPQQGRDVNGDNVADDLGGVVDADGDNAADSIDINNDGTMDGFAVDTDGDGVADGLALDTDCDGFFDAVDTTGDGRAEWATNKAPSQPDNPDTACAPSLGSSGAGGSTGTGGTTGAGGTTGGTGGSTGGSGGGGTGGSGPSQLGMAQYQGSGSSTDQYAESDVYRNGVGYKFIANGWGSGWAGHSISWNGTSFTVASLNGSQGQNYSPAGYPTMFCGLYSMKQSIGSCGLPAAITSLSTVRTGWRWKANGNAGQYNAAWDIWLGNGNTLSAYLMVWLRDPPGQQPAGAAGIAGATIANVPGSWNIWTGTVNGHPIVNYVKAEGQDLSELEFDIMDVYRDAIQRNYNLPGTHIIAAAIGFEVWNGPITNLVTEDFYVDVN